MNDGKSLLSFYLNLRRTSNFDRSSTIGSNERPFHVAALIEECARYGFDQACVRHALEPGVLEDGFEYDDESCDEVCLRLIENILLRAELIAKGRSHLARNECAMPESLINRLACMMLEACLESWVCPPFSLYLVIRAQLGCLEASSAFPKDGEARQTAAMLLASDPTLSTRAVGRAVKVDHTTISRWQKEPGFQALVDKAPRMTNVRRFIDLWMRARALGEAD